jgi:hypothetical protein
MTAFLDNNSGLANYFQALNDQGVKWAISGSAAVGLLTPYGYRPPSDLDITITDDSFAKAVAVSPPNAVAQDKPATFRCGDGLLLDFPAKGISFSMGGLAVDVMDTGEARDGEYTYRLGLSELAVRNRLTVMVGELAVHIINPFDIAAMKAVQQRGAGQNKFDFLDTEAVLSVFRIDTSYALARAQEIGLTGREWSFLGHAGLMANIGSVPA